MLKKAVTGQRLVRLGPVVRKKRGGRGSPQPKVGLGQGSASVHKVEARRPGVVLRGQLRV